MQLPTAYRYKESWMPAFAGMTVFFIKEMATLPAEATQRAQQARQATAAALSAVLHDRLDIGHRTAGIIVHQVQSQTVIGQLGGGGGIGATTMMARPRSRRRGRIGF